ncbi:Podoplanin [Tupaia chinensis]|uniref:Podoplanin n=2 Tax=Tupaia chinensis TaxID=246437 RepID=L9L5D4_TUPCH|nr:Podoplanin [Tupaia chinensis]
MWKVPVLLFVLGSASLWVLAEGASTVGPEDDMVTPAAEDAMTAPGAEDELVTTGASKEPYEFPGLTTPVSTSVESVTDTYVEDLPTQESTVHAQEESQSTTPPNVVTSQSRDGLATVTLIGIIVGVLLAIGFIGGIIIVVVRKMSGRYS